MSPLRRRMIEDMQIRNLTPNTQRAYVEQVCRFARHFGKSPDQLGPPEIRTYLLYLAQERHLTARSIIVAVAALRFFYTVSLKRLWVIEDDIPAGKQAKTSSGLRRRTPVPRQFRRCRPRRRPLIVHGTGGGRLSPLPCPSPTTGLPWRRFGLTSTFVKRSRNSPDMPTHAAQSAEGRRRTPDRLRPRLDRGTGHRSADR
jgi:hypothetical protein